MSINYSARVAPDVQTIMGVRIVTSPLAIRRVFRRVKGGYMNHWLIRVEVMEPCVLHDRVNNRFYVHPDLMPGILAASKGHP